MQVRNIATSRTAIVAVTAVAVVGVIAGIANAAIPSATGLHVACFNKKSGALRLTEGAKKCSKQEKRTSWNAKGIQGAPGAAGAQGPQGAQGPKGDTGPSNGFWDYSNAIKQVHDTGDDVAALGTIPAGSYVVNFSADYKDGTGGGVLDCTIKAGGLNVASLSSEVEHSRRINVAMTGVAVLAETGDIEVVCDDNGGDETIIFSHVTAVQVGALTQA